MAVRRRARLGALPETFVVEAPPEAERAGLSVGPPNRRRREQGLMAAAMTGGSLVRAERPGPYSLTLAAIGATGRRGSVEHPVRALRTVDDRLVVGDLILTNQASAPAGQIRPQIEARVSSGGLLAYTELYADSPAFWERTRVEVEVVDGATGQVLARGAPQLEGPDDAPRRTVTTVVALHHLPPGRYVARARVLHDAAQLGQVRRPFRVTAPE